MPVLAQLINALVISEEPRTADFFRAVMKLGIYAVFFSSQQQMLQNWKPFHLLLLLCGFPFNPSTALEFDYFQLRKL